MTAWLAHDDRLDAAADVAWQCRACTRIAAAQGRSEAAIWQAFRTFAMLSQMFEENGIATYKGQAPNLMGNPLILTVALEIHSVEARHAAEIRRVRGVRPWDGAFDSPKTKAQSFAAVRPFLVV